MADQRILYFDNAATTRTDDRVVKAMLPYFTELYGNSSGICTFSQEAKKAEDEAREIMAETLGAKENEIYFTSGGTESDNWALKAAADFYRDTKKHIISSKTEHHAVLRTLEHLEKQGFEITYLDVDDSGRISLSELKKAVREDTFLISLMLANNEAGTLQPIEEVSKIAKKHGILLHTDAVQAYGHIPLNVDKLGIDMLSASAHKFYGPKGTGFLYIRNSVKIRSFLHGGKQERGRRAGTQNIPAIVGMAKAASLAHKEMQKNFEHEKDLRNYIVQRLTEEIPHSKINGNLEDRLPGNINISFEGIEAESALLMLDSAGICVSTGSACSSGSLDPSHVLLAMGLSPKEALASLRISIGRENTKAEADILIEELKRIVKRLREFSLM